MENNVIVECEPMKDIELYVIALFIRLITGQIKENQFDVLNALEFTLPEIFRVDSVYAVIEDGQWEHGDSIPAVCVPKFMHIEIKESVYQKALDNDKDALKVITHEIVHQFVELFSQVKNIYCSTKSRSEASIPEECDIESFVEKVTAMLLCPPELLAKPYSAGDLLKNCNISHETLTETERLFESIKTEKMEAPMKAEMILVVLLGMLKSMKTKKLFLAENAKNRNIA